MLCPCFVGVLLCAAGAVGIVSINGLHLREADAKPCSVSGTTVNDGDTFDLSFTGPCIKYRCVNGSIFPGEYGCERVGKCYPLGDTYTRDCVQSQCSLWQGQFTYIRTSEGCPYKNLCLPVNHTVLERCFKYQCSKTESGSFITYNLEPVEWGCEHNNECYPENRTITEDCKTLRCQRIQGAVGFRAETQGCQFGAQCLNVGETTVDSCTTYQCRREELAGVPFFSVTVISTLCEDANHDCKAPGTQFSYNLGGVLRHNCTCQVLSPSSVQYRC